MCAIPNAPDEALEHRYARQQHLVGQEPVDRLFEEQNRAILSGIAERERIIL